METQIYLSVIIQLRENMLIKVSSVIFESLSNVQYFSLQINVVLKTKKKFITSELKFMNIRD